MKKSRTPQEKKELSYEKDRKNNYGENSKSSRKNIPKRKRIVNKTYRTAINQSIKKNISTVIENIGDVDSAVKNVKRKSWKKTPDISLGHYLENKKDETDYGTEISFYEVNRRRFFRNK